MSFIYEPLYEIQNLLYLIKTMIRYYLLQLDLTMKQQTDKHS